MDNSEDEQMHSKSGSRISSAPPGIEQGIEVFHDPDTLPVKVVLNKIGSSPN
jgi:hypothetical protein